MVPRSARLACPRVGTIATERHAGHGCRSNVSGAKRGTGPVEARPARTAVDPCELSGSGRGIAVSRHHAPDGRPTTHDGVLPSTAHPTVTAPHRSRVHLPGRYLRIRSARPEYSARPRRARSSDRAVSHHVSLGGAGRCLDLRMAIAPIVRALVGRADPEQRRLIERLAEDLKTDR